MGIQKKKILVLGGSRFFGKRLVERLIQLGHQVLLFNRGNTPEIPNATRIIGDRNSPSDLESAAKQGPFDIIYDQICMDAFDAKLVADHLIDNCSHYIMTSTQSVYDEGALHKEESITVELDEPSKLIKSSQNYGLAKRQADQFLLAHFLKKSTTLRIPIVLGINDYTKRLHWHIERNINKETVHFPNLEAKINFIRSEDLVEKMILLGEIDYRGAINLCSEEPIVLKSLLKLIEAHTNQKFEFTNSPDNGAHSPFGITNTWTMDVSKAKSLELIPPPLEDWLPPLISKLGDEIRKSL